MFDAPPVTARRLPARGTRGPLNGAMAGDSQGARAKMGAR